jgi:hypothetical protein
MLYKYGSLASSNVKYRIDEVYSPLLKNYRKILDNKNKMTTHQNYPMVIEP